MKKSFLIAAMAGLAFVGCTESELDQSVKTQQAISFNAPAVRPNTKAAQEIGNTYDTGLQFNVFGTWHSETYNGYAAEKIYINEATAQYGVGGGNTWYPLNGGNYYYWPKNGTITFSAYSPASTKMADAATYGATGIVLTDYVVGNSNNAAMEDVLFSERAYNNSSSTGTGTPYEGVDIQFKHALSSILFTTKLGKEYAGTQVRITSIKLNNVKSTADFDQNLTDADGKTTKMPDGSGNSTNVAVWSGHDVPVTYTVDNAENILGTNAYYPSTASQTAPVATNYRKSDFILIPQTLEGVELAIEYTVKSSDSAELPQSFTKTFTASDEWIIGYRYIYNITIDFDPITLNPIVSVFADATPSTGIEL